MSSLIGQSGGVECRLTQSEHEKTSSSLQQELDIECSIVNHMWPSRKSEK